MDQTETLKIVMLKTGTTQVVLAKRTGQTQGNLSHKLRRNNFTILEYEELLNAMDCELEIHVVLPDGTKI